MTDEENNNADSDGSEDAASDNATETTSSPEATSSETASHDEGPAGESGPVGDEGTPGDPPPPISETGSDTAEEPPPAEEPCECKTKVSLRACHEVIEEVSTQTVNLVGKPHTVTAVRLKNGFTIVETSTCVDPDNYSEETGQAVNLEKIISKIWMLLGYELQTKLAAEDDPCTEAILTVLREKFESMIGGDSFSDEELKECVTQITRVLNDEGDYRDRVSQEHALLQRKVTKLQAFIDTSESFAALTPNEQKNLRNQLVAMQNYLRLLALRIANFAAPAADEDDDDFD